MYENLLIATDGSELATKALSHGLALAKDEGASVVVVTVTLLWSPLQLKHRVRESGARVVEEYERWARDYAGSVLADAAEQADGMGLHCQTRHISGRHPAEAILKAAQDEGCDLIVMSTHAWRGLDRVVLGSEAMEVLSRTQIPVLIVR